RILMTIIMRPLFFFQAEDGIRDRNVTGVQTCALPISGFGMVGPHFDASDPGQRYDEHENDHQSNGDDVIPTEVGADPVHRPKNRGVSLIGPYRSPDHKRHNDCGRCDEDWFIDRSVFWLALQRVWGS